FERPPTDRLGAEGLPGRAARAEIEVDLAPAAGAVFRWQRGVPGRGGRMSRSRTMLAVILPLALFVAGLALGEEMKMSAADMAARNVLITLTISKTGGTGPGEKIYKMIGQDGSDANMMVGWRTPIPTTSAPKDDSGKAGTTNYIYQNVGVNAKLS